MVTVLVALARVAMVHHRRAEAARAVTEKAAMSKEAVAATRAVMVLWIAALLTTATTAVLPHARTLAIMATADSRAVARTATAIIMKHAAATVIVILKLTINRID